MVDAFVDALDLAALGFDGVIPEETGRPSYHPATMLKIYIYGYLNQVQSSRGLERECRRNLELIWLTGRLAPDFKTIADFRRDNGPAIRKVCAQFVALCRGLDLLDASIVAIDGSKFKAVNAKAKSFTREKLQSAPGRDRCGHRPVSGRARPRRRSGEQDRHVSAGRSATGAGDQEAGPLQEGSRCARSAIEQRMDSSGETQVSLTDPDARAMATTSRTAPRRRLQRAKCRRDEASPDRRARGDEPRLRP